MKKQLTALLALLLCAALMGGAWAADGGRDITSESIMASQLQYLGLLRGVGKNEDGSTDFALGRPMNRTEAVTMLVRALGQDAAAKDAGKTHPFTDVPAWADGYVSYAYDNGLTKGVSKDLFGADQTVSGEMYVTFMLRALGYQDKTDFEWIDPWSLADVCGIPELRTEDFLRADAVTVTYHALTAVCKDSETTLLQKLFDSGALTEAQYTYAAAVTGLLTAHYNDKSFTRFLSQQETAYCIVLKSALAGVPHGPTYFLTVVYTADTIGHKAGDVVELPLPRANFIGTPAEPEDLKIEGDTLTYTCTTEVPETYEDGQILHEAGLFEYSAYLPTGITALAPVQLPK